MDEFASTINFSSNKQDWETPQKYFDELNEKYHFSYDLAASKENHKCDDYFTEKDDSLSQKWEQLKGNLFLNPPYSRKLKKWVKKAYESSLEKQEGNIILLIPSRTDTSYWHDYIFGKAKIVFIRGRLKFEYDGMPKDSAPFPSALIIYECKGR